jgi:hypothetical protein
MLMASRTWRGSISEGGIWLDRSLFYKIIERKFTIDSPPSQAENEESKVVKLTGRQGPGLEPPPGRSGSKFPREPSG